MTDNGLPAAVARVTRARQDHGLNLMDERCRCGWGDSADYDAYLAHRDEAVARAAREDVAETVREAQVKALTEIALHIEGYNEQCSGEPVCHRSDVSTILCRAAAIRAGEA